MQCNETGRKQLTNIRENTRERMFVPVHLGCKSLRVEESHNMCLFTTRWSCLYYHHTMCSCKYSQSSMQWQETGCKQLTNIVFGAAVYQGRVQWRGCLLPRISAANPLACVRVRHNLCLLTRADTNTKTRSSPESFALNVVFQLNNRRGIAFIAIINNNSKLQQYTGAVHIIDITKL